MNFRKRRKQGSCFTGRNPEAVRKFFINEKRGIARKKSIRERDTKKGKIRYLCADGAIESAMFLEPGRRNELVFPYLRQLSCAFSFRPEIRETLLIGGGAFAYPRYYLSHYPERKIDVIEADEGMVRMARRHFFLDDLVRESEPRLQIYIEDGFDYLLRCGKRYDFIIDDAYTGSKAASSLRSDDGMRLVRARLAPGGIYAANVVTAERGPFAMRGREMRRLMERHFRYVATVPCDEARGAWGRQNWVYLGAGEEL